MISSLLCEVEIKANQNISEVIKRFCYNTNYNLPQKYFFDNIMSDIVLNNNESVLIYNHFNGEIDNGYLTFNREKQIVEKYYDSNIYLEMFDFEISNDDLNRIINYWKWLYHKDELPDPESLGFYAKNKIGNNILLLGNKD